MRHQSEAISCAGLIARSKNLFAVEQLRLGTVVSCFIDRRLPDQLYQGRFNVAGAIRYKTIRSFWTSPVCFAIILPIVGFTVALLSCSVFWWKHRDDILSFTQSG